VRAGTPIQVLRVAGVRLEVWADEVVGSGDTDELSASLPDDGSAGGSGPSSPSETTSEGGR
jgi:hypothetical protein